MVGIGIIIIGVDVGADEEYERPERWEKGENLFRFFGDAGCRAHNEIRRRKEKQNEGGQAKSFENGRNGACKKLFGIVKDEQKADRDENEAEQCACEYGKLICRSGERFKFPFPQKKIRGRRYDDGEAKRVSEHLQGRLGIGGIFVVVRVIILKHQHDPPNGKTDAKENGGRQIDAHDLFREQ